MVASIESATSISIDPITLNSEELLSGPEGLETPSPRRDLEKQQRRINAIFGRQLAAHRSQASQLQMHQTKGKIKKWWKKHKKKVLIGAVLVAAATLTIVTGGNGAPAAGAAVSGVAGSKKKKKKRPPVNKPGQVGMPPPASIAKPRSSRPIAQTISQPKNLVLNTLKIPQSTPALKPFQISDIIPKALSAQQTPPKNWKLPMKLPNPSSKQSTSQSPKIVSNLPNRQPPKPSIANVPMPKALSAKKTPRKNPMLKPSFQPVTEQLKPLSILKKKTVLKNISSVQSPVSTTIFTQKKLFDPVEYLEKSSQYFKLGQYDKSIEEFRKFSKQSEMKKPSLKNTQNIPSFDLEFPQRTPEFQEGFYEGIKEGAVESGKGIILFLGDFINRPIHTSKQVFGAVSTLVELARNGESSAVLEALSPELHKLVTEEDTLSDREKGKLLGKGLTKHGTDIIVPGAAAKIASKGIKGAKKFAAAARNLKLAKETLILETAAEIGNATKVKEIVLAGERTTKEMGRLKKAGTLEKTVSSAYESLSPAMKESFDLFNKAQESLKPYREFMPEKRVRELIHQTGIKTPPRPKGIPENFRVKISNKGAGIKFVHPDHNHTSIRVMPGKPHSPLSHQRKPYAIQRVNGKTLDKFGKEVNIDAPEAHIPLEEFLYLGK